MIVVFKKSHVGKKLRNLCIQITNVSECDNALGFYVVKEDNLCIWNSKNTFAAVAAFGG